MPYSRRSIAVTITLVLLAAFLYFWRLSSIPVVLYDEAPYADTALAFFKGSGFTNQLGGLSGQQFFLYPFIVSLSFFLLGPSLWAARAASAMCGLISIGLFDLILRRFYLTDTMRLVMGIGFLLLNTTIMSFRIVRPESLHILLALGLVLLLFPSRPTRWHAVLVGMMMGALTLTHLIGFILAIGIGVGWLWVHFRQDYPMPSLVWVFIGGCPFAGLFITQLALHCGGLVAIPSFLSQTGKIGAVHTDGSSLWSLNWKTIVWPGYVMGIKRLWISLVELGGMAWGLAYGKGIVGLIAMALSVYLGLGLGFIHLFLRPYFSILPVFTLLILAWYWPRVNGQWRWVLALIIGLYIANQAAGTLYVLAKHAKNQPMTSSVLSEQLAQQPSWPILSLRQQWFVEPTRTWLVHQDTYQHEALLRQYGGYFILLVTPKETDRSPISQTPAVVADTYTTRTVKTLQHLSNTVGQLVATDYRHPYGQRLLYRVESSRKLP